MLPQQGSPVIHQSKLLVERGIICMQRGKEGRDSLEVVAHGRGETQTFLPELLQTLVHDQGSSFPGSSMSLFQLFRYVVCEMAMACSRHTRWHAKWHWNVAVCSHVSRPWPTF